MDSEKRLGSEELVAALRKDCRDCGSNSLCLNGEMNVYCAVRDAADRLEEYVDRCARFSEEIMELREQRKKVEQPGGCAFAPWCDAVREQRRWIPVSERLPERDGPVLAYYGFSKGGEISEMRFFSVMDYYAVDPKPHFQHEGYQGLTVTHWMTLPPAPEEVKGNGKDG